MANPLLTALFDLFLIGCAIAVVAAMAEEYLASRTPAVGRRRHTRPRPAVDATRGRRASVAARRPPRGAAHV